MSANATFKQLLEGISEIQNQKAQEAKITSAIQGVAENPTSMTAFLNLMNVAPEVGKGFLAAQQMQAAQQKEGAQQQQQLLENIQDVQIAKNVADAAEDYYYTNSLGSLGRGARLPLAGWNIANRKTFNTHAKNIITPLIAELERQGNKQLSSYLNDQLKNLDKQDVDVLRQIPTIIKEIRDYAQNKENALNLSTPSSALTPQQIQQAQNSIRRDSTQLGKPYAEQTPVGGMSSNLQGVREAAARDIDSRQEMQQPAPSSESGKKEQELQSGSSEKKGFFERLGERMAITTPLLTPEAALLTSALTKETQAEDQKLIENKDAILEAAEQGLLTPLGESDSVDRLTGKQAARSALDFGSGAAVGKMGGVLDVFNLAGGVLQSQEAKSLFKNSERIQGMLPYFQERLGLSRMDTLKLIDSKEGRALLTAIYREDRRSGEFGKFQKYFGELRDYLAEFPSTSKLVGTLNEMAGEELLPDTKMDKKAFGTGVLFGGFGGGATRTTRSLGKAVAPAKGLKGIAKSSMPLAEKVGKGKELLKGVAKEAAPIVREKAIRGGVAIGAAVAINKGGEIAKEFAENMPYTDGVLGDLAILATEGLLMRKASRKIASVKRGKVLDATSVKLKKDVVKAAHEQYNQVKEKLSGDVTFANKASPLEQTAKNINDISIKYGIQENPLVMGIDKGVADVMNKGGEAKQWIVTPKEFAAAEELAKNNTVKILRQGMIEEGDVGGIKGMSNKKAEQHITDLYKQLDAHSHKLLTVDQQNIDNVVRWGVDLHKNNYGVDGLGGEPQTFIGKKAKHVFQEAFKELGVDLQRIEEIGGMKNSKILNELIKETYEKAVSLLSKKPLRMERFLKANKSLNDLRRAARETLRNRNSTTPEKMEARNTLQTVRSVQEMLRDSYVPQELSIILQQADRGYAQLQSRLTVQDIIQDIESNGLGEIKNYMKSTHLEDLLTELGATKNKKTTLSDSVKDAFLYGDHFAYNNAKAVHITQIVPFDRSLGNVFSQLWAPVQRVYKQGIYYARTRFGERPYDSYTTQSFASGELKPAVPVSNIEVLKRAAIAANADRLEEKRSKKVRGKRK